MFIVGNITDQITSIIWGYLSNKPFTISDSILANYSVYQDMLFSFTHPWLSNEPLFFLIMSLMGTFLGPNSLNIYLIIVTLVNFCAFWYAFKQFKFWWFGALAFSLSPYYYVHLGIHPDLINVWGVPLFYKLYIDQKNKFLPFFILLVTLFSNYVGFVLIILMCTLTATKYISYFLIKNNTSGLDRKLILRDLKLIIVTGLLLFLFLFRFIALNYFKENNTTVDPYILNRSVIDFTIFSARPWYFFIPSEKNPVLGDFARYENSKLKKVSNYLFHQYYPEEHVSLFLGFSLYVALLMALFDKSYSKKNKLLLGLNLTIIFIAMLPPEITLKGQVIYLPSYLIYKVFPVFRVTTRMVLAFHLLILVFLIDYFQYKYAAQQKIYQKKISLFVAILTLLVLIETFIPVKMRTIFPPQEYQYIQDNSEVDAYLNVYPYSKAREALLWLPVHKRKLANVPGVVINGYDSKTYTENIFNSEYPIIGDYFLVDNKYLDLVPENFKLLKTFDNSALYLKK